MIWLFVLSCLDTWSISLIPEEKQVLQGLDLKLLTKHSFYSATNLKQISQKQADLNINRRLFSISLQWSLCVFYFRLFL